MVVVRVVTSIVVMSWPLLLGGLLLSASPAMSESIRPGYNMIPMSYPPHPLPYPPEMSVHPLRANQTIQRLSYPPQPLPYPPETSVQPLRANRTIHRLSYPEHDPKHKRYNRRVQEEIRRRTEAMMRRDSPSMKKITARIALLGMVSMIVCAVVAAKNYTMYVLLLENRSIKPRGPGEKEGSK